MSCKCGCVSQTRFQFRQPGRKQAFRSRVSVPKDSFHENSRLSVCPASRHALVLQSRSRMEVAATSVLAMVATISSGRIKVMVSVYKQLMASVIEMLKVPADKPVKI